MRRIATIGTFDGLHGGHRSLLAHMSDEARRRGLAPLAVTFDRHPLEVVAPGRVPPLLASRADLPRLIALESGISDVVALEFTRELAALTASEFMAMLRRDYDVDVVMMGYDNTLGSDRPATPEAYAEAGRRAGVEVIFDTPYVNPATGHTPSSTMLRECLAHGDVAAYAAEAGRPYAVTGIVAHGLRNGHRLGFPTLNVDIRPDICVPGRGVYKGIVDIDGSRYDAVVNIGINPTIGRATAATVEAHVPDTDLGDCYGRSVTVEFLRKLRDERRFDSLDELRRSIADDIKSARQ